MKHQHLTEASQKAYATRLVNKELAGQRTFTPTYENTAHLLDQVGKIEMFDTDFKNPLNKYVKGQFNGEKKIIEETYLDLYPATDFSDEDPQILKPAKDAYFKPCYSYPLKQQKVKVTLKGNDIGKAVITQEELAMFTIKQSQRLEDSKSEAQYVTIKQMFGNAIKKAKEAMNTGKTFTTRTAYEMGEYLKKSGTTTVGVVIWDIPVTNDKDFDTLVTEKYLVPMDLITVIEEPVDTLTGEAFIKQVKKDAQKTTHRSWGHSFNGNTIGAINNLDLLLLEDIKSVLEVDVEAGTFHDEKVALPANVTYVEDFGDDTEAFGIMFDSRMFALYTNYNKADYDHIGEGDFTNYIKLWQDTAFIGMNTYFKVYLKKTA